MKKIFGLLYISVLLITLSSCEDFLQKDPPSSPSEAVFWKSKADFEYGMTACYSVMYDNSCLSSDMAYWDCLSDNAYVRHDNDMKTMTQGNITSETGYFLTGLYSVSYKGIARVHQVMSQLEKYEGKDITDAERDILLGQSKALRGYFYSWLYLCFKEVPLVTELLDLETMYQPKAERSAIYAQIMKDFDESIALLSPHFDLHYTDQKVVGRMTPAAIKALKAKVMIFNAYKSGVADANMMQEILAVLEGISGYDLATTMRDNFLSSKQKDSKEIMFSVRYLVPNITNGIDQNYGTWSSNMISRDFVNTFEYTDGLSWDESPLAVEVDESLINTKDPDLKDAQRAEREKLYLNRDKRLYHSVSHSDVAKFGEGDDTWEITYGSDGTFTGFSLKKNIQEIKEVPGYSTLSDADVVIVRYAHVLLMLAEVENEVNGPTSKVYDAINKIRNRSEQPDLPIGLSKEEMRERIRKEWRIETAFEGLRYFQMKQWDLLPNLNTLKDPMYDFDLKFEPEFIFWPLPQSEIDKANGILIQDPAYK